MKMKITILTIVLLAMTVTSVFAGNDRRRGTDAASELLIPVGSRGTAMGGAVVANTSGVEAIYWNPAGLASLDGTEVMFTHQPYLADIDINFFGVGTNIEDFGTIAATVKVVAIGDMEETTSEYPDGTGRIFSPTYSVIGVSYARILTANVSVGFNASFIHENVFEVQSSGVCFDIGFMYDPNWHGLSLGIVVKNYGPEMTFNGMGFNDAMSGEDRTGRVQAASHNLPSFISMGIAYDMYDQGPHLATISGNFRSNNFYEDYWQGGAEYIYDGKYSVRAGYTMANHDEYLYGPSFGAGLMFNLGSADMKFEYTWTKTDVFDDNQYFTMKMAF